MDKILYNILFLLLPVICVGQQRALDNFSVTRDAQSYYYVISNGDTISNHNTLYKAIDSARRYAKKANGVAIKITRNALFKINYDYVSTPDTIYAPTDSITIAQRVKLGMKKSEVIDLWGVPTFKRSYPIADKWFWDYDEKQKYSKDFNFIVFKEDTVRAIKIKHQGSPLEND